MQFLSRRSCIKFRTCSKLDATSARQNCIELRDKNHLCKRAFMESGIACNARSFLRRAVNKLVIEPLIVESDCFFLARGWLIHVVNNS